MDIARCSAGGYGKADSHACSATQHHLSTPDNIVQACSDDCRNPAGDRVDDVEQQLSIGIGNADIATR